MRDHGRRKQLQATVKDPCTVSPTEAFYDFFSFYLDVFNSKQWQLSTECTVVVRNLCILIMGIHFLKVIKDAIISLWKKNWFNKIIKSPK